MWKGVELPASIATQNLGLGLQILNREAKNIKLNGAVIVASKLTNRQQISNKMWSDKNIIELKNMISYRKNGSATTRNWNGGPIADYDEGRRMR